MRRLVTTKEKWDSSRAKANELTMSMFGTPDEVREMAKPIRVAKDRAEAREILQKIALQGMLISKSGAKAALSGKSIDKIISEFSLNESYDQLAHWQAAANIDKLFSNAIEPWEFALNPNKQNTGLKTRKYLYAPLEYNNRIIPVKITVKEYIQKADGVRLYSIEAIDADIKTEGAGH
jgi:hypothetical protein